MKKMKEWGLKIKKSNKRKASVWAQFAGFEAAKKPREEVKINVEK